MDSPTPIKPDSMQRNIENVDQLSHQLDGTSSTTHTNESRTKFAAEIAEAREKDKEGRAGRLRTEGEKSALPGREEDRV